MKGDICMEKTDIIHIFEHEFGRLLTPLEIEFILDWKNDSFSEEQIIKALKQSVYNGVLNFKYINKILQSFKSTDVPPSPSISDDDLNWLDEKM